jgi:formiminotetrahydrofolate cyclodeaminase
MSLLDLTVREFLARLAAPTPTPGGGSVAALAGALSAGLGQMVAAYTVGRPKFATVATRAQELATRLQRAATLLSELVDEDAAAYEVLSAALKLNRADPQRTERVARAAALAAQVPLQSAAACAAVITDLAELQQIGNPNLASDAAAAGHLARAALAAAAANVRANLPLLAPGDAATFEAQLAALFPSP